MKLFVVAIAIGLVVLPLFFGAQPSKADSAIQALNQTVDARIAKRLSLLKASPYLSVNLSAKL